MAESHPAKPEFSIVVFVPTFLPTQSRIPAAFLHLKIIVLGRKATQIDAPLADQAV